VSTARPNKRMKQPGRLAAPAGAGYHPRSVGGAAKTPAVEDSPVSAALANAAVLMSLVILFLATPSPVSVIVILTAITILRQPALGGPGAAYGLVMGNVAGGLAAIAAHLLVVLFPAPAFLLVVTLFFGLVFGAKIAEGGESNPVYVVGLVTFLIVFGLGLAPLPTDSGTIFVSRVFNVIVAAVYTIGIASVLRSLFRARVRSASNAL